MQEDVFYHMGSFEEKLWHICQHTSLKKPKIIEGPYIPICN